MTIDLLKLSQLHAVAGIRVGTTCAHIKQTQKTHRDDLVLFELAPHCTAAAVFTRNAFCAAPITLARQHLNTTVPRFLLINSGNANAGTGHYGIEDATHCCETVAQQAQCTLEEVLPFSTGVIGQRLPVEKIRAAIPIALTQLDSQGWEKAAQAIMTTDTVPKGLSVQINIQGHLITVTGIAKGAGMIRPDMATMLAFIATDAAVNNVTLQACLNHAVERSFNRITIDGDTSTNDACILVATGRSDLALIDSPDHPSFNHLQAAVEAVCQYLAQAIVRDGEGATKFITLVVEQGASEQECLTVAYTIAHSPLVKTAFFASDANWGRILAAVGRAGIPHLDINTVKIYLGDVCVVQDGGVADSYTEEQGQQIMRETEICIRVSLGRGYHQAQIWTCDFSYDYVRINAEYRT